MPIEDTKAPPLSSEAYAHCFLTFRKYSTEWLSMLRWCRQRLATCLPVKSPFRALSVGAGNGDFDWRLLPILKAHISSLEYIFVEPSQAMCRRLRQRIGSQPLHGVKFDLESSCFETCPLEQTFNLVLLTHCLYYIPDRETAIGHASRLAGESGSVLIFHQTPLGIDQVQKKFIKRIKGTEQEMFTSHDIQKILARRHTPNQLEQIESYIDVSECFLRGSTEGEALLSFFLECDVRHIDPALKREVVEYIYALSYPDQGKRLLRHPVAVFRLSMGMS